MITPYSLIACSRVKSVVCINKAIERKSMLLKTIFLCVFVFLILTGAVFADYAQELMSKFSYQDIEGLEKLISSGADVNAKAKDGATAIGLAIKENDKDMVALLKENGAKE